MASTQDKVLDFITVVIIALAILQAGSFIATQLFSLGLLKLGSAFFILAIAGSAVGAFTIIRGAGKLKREDTIMVVLAVAVLIAFMFYGKELIPSIFDEQSFMSLMSAIGM